MVNWIKDVDTGELFPIPDNPDIEVPAHLELAEYTPVDYEKTTKMTIDELQNQLLAAQNQIEEMQKTESDTSSSEIVQYQGRLDADRIFNEGKSRSFDFNIIFYSIVTLLLITVAVFIFIFYIKSDDFDTSSSEISEYQLFEQYDQSEFQEQYQEQEQNHKSDKMYLQYYIDKYSDSPFGFVFKIIPILVTVLVIRFAIRFMISTIKGS